MTWLDPRLSYGAAQPPDPSRSVDLQRWQVPITVQGRPTALTGLIRWVAAESPSTPTRRTSRSRDLFIGLGVLMLIVAAAAAASAALRLRARPPQDKSGETW